MSFERASQRLVIIFVATILVPGVLLAIYGFRALYFERRVADQQIRERLETSAIALERRLELEFAAWRAALEYPDQITKLRGDADSIVTLVREGDRLRVWPHGALLYSLIGNPPHVQQTPPAIAEAEALELRHRSYAEAAGAYRRLLGSARPPERAIVLHHLARTLNKAGQTQEALAAYRLLEKEPVTGIGSLPSDLLAVHGSGDPLRLYRDLVGGRWQLEKASYLYYSETARENLSQGEAKAGLEQMERRKLALTRAAERFLESPRSFDSGPDGYFLAFWRNEPLRAVLLGGSFLRARVWPPLFQDSGVRFSLTGPDGHLLFGETPTGVQLTVKQSLAGIDPPLRLQAWPANTSALDERVSRQHSFYLGMLAVVVGLLAFGTYLVVRMVKTELEMAQIKSDFVSAVSHEFRTPLAGLNQLGEMLRDGRVKDEHRRQDYYEMIVKETQRLRRLVENVLDFSRIDAGRKQYRFEPFEAGPWLRHVAEDFQAEISAAGFRIEAAIPVSLPIVIGDREALATAVHNLLDNAVKYSAASRTVWLNAVENAGGLSISVRDRGDGIPEGRRDRIFEKFYRGEPAQEVKGVGLGLSLVKHIVTAHGGAVEFETREGEGSTFTIHLRSGR